MVGGDTTTRPKASLAGPRAPAGHVVAVLLPMSGSAGIWGPSCISSAQLAIAEINAGRGIRGSPIVPVFLDGDDGRSDRLERELGELMAGGELRGLVGMSVSSVRQRLNRLLGGRIPHVYTPLYEGRERSPNVYTIGETPRDQLEPAIDRLGELLRVRRWALVGNDYVWPRASHRVASRRIAAKGGEVVFDGYVPFGLEDAEWLVERIMARRPDIVLISLVGQDAVEFNRAFGRLDADRRAFRFSTAIDENVLLATGEDNTRRLFVASGYFAGLGTPQNEVFTEQYVAAHKGCPPMLNSLGQSLYEGIHFYSALRGQAGAGEGRGPVRYPSARRGVWFANDRNAPAVHLARADGHCFAILEQLA